MGIRDRIYKVAEQAQAKVAQVTDKASERVSHAKDKIPGMTGIPSADWLDDPFDRHEHRYWDGSQWTDQVSDAGETGTDPPDRTEYREPEPEASAVVSDDGSLFRGISHDPGRNAEVTLWPDRIERTKAKRRTSLSSADQGRRNVALRGFSSSPSASRPRHLRRCRRPYLIRGEFAEQKARPLGGG